MGGERERDLSITKLLKTLLSWLDIQIDAVLLQSISIPVEALNWRLPDWDASGKCITAELEINID